MSRQHAGKAQPRTPRSSVWIDPAVSTYLQGEQIEPIEQSSPALSHLVAPATPIPPRASAQRIRAVNVRPRYPYARTRASAESDAIDVPTQPPPATWEYASDVYTAGSSLSSLSVIVDTPTYPRGIPTPSATLDTPSQGMPRIEEMETRPPTILKSTIDGIVDSTVSYPQETHLTIEEESTSLHGNVGTRFSPSVRPSGNIPSPRQHADGLKRVPTSSLKEREIAEQHTMRMQLSPALLEQLPGAASLFLGTPGSTHNAPTLAQTPAMPVVISPHGRPLASMEPTSWTAGAAAGSRYAQLVAAPVRRQKAGSSFNLLDKLRWWLLHPGRFEFVLWLGGTILLMTVTCIFLLMMAFSVPWGAANVNNGASSSFKHTHNPAGGQITTPGASLAVTHAGALIAGQPLHLRGTGFSANNHIALSYDANRLFLNQNGQPVLAQADAHGTFTVTLPGPSWSIGQHRIVARDITTGYLATATVTVVAATKSATMPPAVTATAIQQGNIPPPNGQTPTVVPTTGITPTATPEPPTPTVGITPTATVGATPTVGVTPTPHLGQTPPVEMSVTPNLSETAPVGSTNLAILNTQDVANSTGAAITVSPWLWLLIGGYTIAMLLFGLAGLLHKR